MCSARTADRRLDALGAWGFTLATIVSFGSLLVLAAWSWAAAVVDTQQLMSPATAIVLGLIGAGFALLHLRLRLAAAAAFIAPPPWGRHRSRPLPCSPSRPSPIPPAA